MPSDTEQHKTERPSMVAQHFIEIQSVIEQAVEAITSLNDLEDGINDELYARLSEYVTKLYDCLYSLDRGFYTLKTNFYIYPKKPLPSERIDYVDPLVDERMR
jgi:hypothetical protein